MTVTRHNIAGVEPPPGGSHVTAGRGDLIVHVSGQVGTDESGMVVPGLAAQTERALLNVALALDTAGVSLDELVKMTTYVVDWDLSMYDELIRGGSAARAQRTFPDTALTLIGVKSLFTPEMLIEIEAVAIVDS
ncbi:MAG: RidA family protein [Chloroflexota bacterium]|nr:RidA family protein [Chloroflexota bacterium]